jgi:hypothetical protein
MNGEDGSRDVPFKIMNPLTSNLHSNEDPGTFKTGCIKTKFFCQREMQITLPFCLLSSAYKESDIYEQSRVIISSFSESLCW